MTIKLFLYIILSTPLLLFYNIIDGSALQIWRAPGENQPQKFVGPN